LLENIRRARHNGNNALYEALEVVQNENRCLMRLVASQRRRIQSLETELIELRANAVSRVQDRLANDEEELRRLRVEERRREGNN
ncbi:26759_t:CDS:2, partial [Racocetra persica]